MVFKKEDKRLLTLRLAYHLAFVRHRGGDQCLYIELLASFETRAMKIPSPYSDKWRNDRSV